MSTTDGERKDENELQNTEDVLRIRDAELASLKKRQKKYSESESGRMVSEINKACAQDLARTAQERAILDANFLSKVAETLNKAGSIAVSGGKAAGLDATTSRTGVTAIGATFAVAGAIHTFSTDLTVKQLLYPMAMETMGREAEALQKSKKDELRKTVEKQVKTWMYSKHPELEAIAKLETEVEQYTHEILQLKNREAIAKEIHEIVKEIESNREKHNKDYTAFKKFRDGLIVERLNRLNTLIEETATFDPNFPIQPITVDEMQLYTDSDQLKACFTEKLNKIDKAQEAVQNKEKKLLAENAEKLIAKLTQEITDDKQREKITAGIIEGLAGGLNIRTSTETPVTAGSSKEFFELYKLAQAMQLIPEKQQKTQSHPGLKRGLGRAKLKPLPVNPPQNVTDFLKQLEKMEQEKTTALQQREQQKEKAVHEEYNSKEKQIKYLKQLQEALTAQAVPQQHDARKKDRLQQQLEKSLSELEVTKKAEEETVSWEKETFESHVKFYAKQDPTTIEAIKAKIGGMTEKSSVATQIALHSVTRATGSMRPGLNALTFSTANLPDVKVKAEKSMQTAAEATKAKATVAGTQAVLNAILAVPIASSTYDLKATEEACNKLILEAETIIHRLTSNKVSKSAAEKALSEMRKQKTPAAMINGIRATLALQEAKLKVATTLASAAATDLKLIQTQLTLTSVAKQQQQSILAPVSEVVTTIGTVIPLLTTQTTAESGKELNDRLNIIEAVTREAGLLVPASRVSKLSAAKQAVKEMFEPNETAKEVIRWFTTDGTFKQAIKKIQDLDSESMTLSLDNTLWQDSNKKTLPPEAILKNISKALEEANKNFNDCIESLDDLNKVSVLFSPYDNAEKARSQFFAESKAIEYLQKIAETKKLLVTANKALKQVPGDFQQQHTELTEDIFHQIEQLNEAEEAMKVAIKMQQKNFKTQDQENEKYCRPYVNIFTNANNPTLELSLQNAQFSDLLMVLSEANMNEFSGFLQHSSLVRLKQYPLVQKFISLYSEDIDLLKEDELKTLLEDRFSFSNNMVSANSDELEALSTMWTKYLTRKRMRGDTWTHLDFKTTNGKTFKSDSELQEYLQQNEEFYHADRVLHLGKDALLTSIEQGFNQELNLLNAKVRNSKQAEMKQEAEATPVPTVKIHPTETKLKAEEAKPVTRPASPNAADAKTAREQAAAKAAQLVQRTGTSTVLHQHQRKAPPPPPPGSPKKAPPPPPGSHKKNPPDPPAGGPKPPWK